MATITDTREVSGFRTVVMRGYGDLEIHQERGASVKESVSIQADADIMPRILAEVRGDRLVLGFSMPWYDWIWWWWQWIFTADKRIRFTLASRNVESLRITGAGRVKSDRFEAERLELAISGAGKIHLAGVAVRSLETRLSGAADVELEGSSDRHDLHISGAGTIRARGLATKRTEAAMSGAGSCVVNAADELDVRISGAGSVSYTGHPRVTQSISGAGRVRQEA